MFYVGNVLWFSDKQETIPDQFTGIVYQSYSQGFMSDYMAWYKDGKLHRDENSLEGDGPARIYFHITFLDWDPSGLGHFRSGKKCQYWINGVLINTERISI